MLQSKKPKPIVLLLLDGWGYREEMRYNAIAVAETPYWDHLVRTCPYTLLNASGLSVGLPEGQMGNSEVGHLTIGAGRVVFQSLTRINKAIEDGGFITNKVLLSALKKANDKQVAVHIVGLVSSGGVHSHEKHIYALLELCAQRSIKKCYIHAILDGRDTPPKSASISLHALEGKCKRLRLGQIVSLMGRYYAMDRDNRWERTEVAYNCMVGAEAPYSASTAFVGLQQAYARGETDEFVQPTYIHKSGELPIGIQSGDIVFFMNFRADRALQLSRAFLDPNFSSFRRMDALHLGDFVALTEYAADLLPAIAFPKQSLKNSLGECLAQAGLTQLRIAETEKYAHVTFFFNGGLALPFIHETRLLIPSQTVTTYDLAPQMRVVEITDEVVKAIENQSYDVIICNFANPDMLGHTGNQLATQRGITCMDRCMGKIVSSLKKQGGEAIITADHGNAEYMYDEKTKQAHTAHTTAPVPFLYVGRPAKIIEQGPGTLADIAPTLLALLDLPPSYEMTGNNLLVFT